MGLITGALALGGKILGSKAGSAAIGGLASSALGNLLGKGSADTAMQFGEAQRRNQHQVEVADLRKAGLNPILSAHKGAGTTGGHTYNPKVDAAQAALAMSQARKVWYEGSALKPKAVMGDELGTSLENATSSAKDAIKSVAKSPNKVDLFTGGKFKKPKAYSPDRPIRSFVDPKQMWNK